MMVKIGTMLSTLNKHRNKGDMADIEDSFGCNADQSIEPLTHFVCDKISSNSNEKDQEENIIIFVPKELLGKKNIEYQICV